MKLTTKKQIHALPIGSKLYHINPYSEDNQNIVAIETITVEKKKGKPSGCYFDGSCLVCEGRERYYSDLLLGCKSLFTTHNEAVKELKRVHSGVYAETVRAHHMSVKL